MRSIIILMNLVFFCNCIMKCINILKVSQPSDQYFSNDQCMMLQNYALLKDPVKVENRLTDFNGRV